jgi:hypothetical protein
MITVSCNSTIEKLQKAKRDLSHVSRSGKVHDYLYDMWRVGRDTAEECYSQAVTKEGDKAAEKTKYVVPTPNFTADGFELRATGPDLYFLEFGTGLVMDDTNPYAALMGFYPGSYSARNKKFLVPKRVYHFKGAWPHGGKMHWGQNPAKGMYNAAREMEEYARYHSMRLF